MDSNILTKCFEFQKGGTVPIMRQYIDGVDEKQPNYIDSYRDSSILLQGLESRLGLVLVSVDENRNMSSYDLNHNAIFSNFTSFVWIILAISPQVLFNF